MRLEFETNLETLPFTNIDVFEDIDISPSGDLDSLLKKGIAAAQGGNRDQARKLLSQAAAIDPGNENAWMWLASISEYPEELLAFLDRVLSINPGNCRASEWRNATRTLLAKTMVQRAAAAHENGSPELSKKCLEQAFTYDNNCAAAWFLQASMVESDNEKLECLNRVIELEPGHQDAISAMNVLQDARSKRVFESVKRTAADGDQASALKLLGGYLIENPDSVEAWVLRSHLSSVLEEKVEALETALEIDPENAAAKSGLAFLALTFGSPSDDGNSGPGDNPPTHVEEDSSFSSENGHQREISASTDSRYEIADLASHPTGGSVHADVAEWPAPAQAAAEDQIGSSEFETQPMEEPESTVETELSGAESFISRSVEEIFGPVETVDPQSKTVERLPDLAMSLGNEDFSHGHDRELDEPHPSEQEDKAVAEIVTASTKESDSSAPDPSDLAEAACPYCFRPNPKQAFRCVGCLSILTLSDLEALFASTKVDRELVQDAVIRMEAEWNLREFDVAEMTALALGHFNLGNTESGLKYLEEASRIVPNNVILAGHVNAIAIRLDEIRRKGEIHDAQPTGKTILVVDDSPTVRKLISGKLEKSGHIVVSAGDGVEALKMLEIELPDLVLLDITMPRMDGYEVCKQIRANPRTKGLPVVMISGKDGFFDKVRGRMAGSTGYVTKPFGPETLMKALETYLLPEA